MNNRILAVILLLCSMGICALFMGCASDGGPKDTTMNYWDKKKGNCDEVLSMPHAYQLSQIRGYQFELLYKHLPLHYPMQQLVHYVKVRVLH